tara:strand:+ start:2000 stop:2740 length:741 start_codon:yes stop_codon:yes gene_type:complete
MQSILITICARGGSKGIPRKNIKLIGATHVIGYSIKHAQKFAALMKSKGRAKVYIELSTDDIEIKEIAKLYGLKNNYTRSPELANDTAGKQDVIKDILLYSEKVNQVKYDLILDLDVSAPMRTLDNLVEAYDVINSLPKIDNLFSVSEAKKNPYFNMVEMNSDGTCSLSKTPKEPILSRQNAPKVYEMNASFYYYKRHFFVPEKMYLFAKSTAFELKHDSFDFDHQVDMDFFEYLIVNNKLNFEIE